MKDGKKMNCDMSNHVVIFTVSLNLNNYVQTRLSLVSQEIAIIDFVVLNIRVDCGGGREGIYAFERDAITIPIESLF